MMKVELQPRRIYRVIECELSFPMNTVLKVIEEVLTETKTPRGEVPVSGKFQVDSTHLKEIKR